MMFKIFKKYKRNVIEYFLWYFLRQICFQPKDMPDFLKISLGIFKHRIKYDLIFPTQPDGHRSINKIW